MNTRCLAALIVIAMPTLAAAQMRVVRTTRPARATTRPAMLITPVVATTRPTTQPAPKPKVYARLVGDAESQLNGISAAYAELKGLELAGKVSLVTEQNGQKRTHDADFTGSFAAPNLFRHQAQRQPLFGSTGKNIYGYTDRGNAYLQAKAPEGRFTFDDLPEDHVKTLALQNPSLLLAIAKDPAEMLRLVSSEISVLPAGQVNGVACFNLKANLNEPKVSAVLAFDQKTKLLKRMTVDYRDMIKAGGGADVTSATYSVDYTTIAANPQAKPEQYAWNPPLGAHDIAKAAPAVDMSDPTGMLIGKPAPDFTLDDLDGKPVKLSDLKGSVVVLDFWATWCGPCIASMPHLERIYNELKPQGLKMFAVNQKEDKEKVEQFVERKSLMIPVLLDAEGKVGSLYRVRGIPTTVLIGKDGNVKHVQVGFAGEEDQTLKMKITEELKGK